MSLDAIQRADPAPRPAPAVAADAVPRAALWWHAAWALAIALGAVVVSVVAPWPDARPGLALIVAATPSIAAILTLRPNRPNLGLVVIWAIASVLAATLAGGASGPLAIWCVTPLAAALVLEVRRIALGAALSLAALAATALIQAAGLAPPAPQGVLALSLALVALATTTVALAAAVAIARAARPIAPAQAQPEPLAALVAAQPHLIVVVNDEGAIERSGGGMNGDLQARLSGLGLMGAAEPSAREAIVNALAQARRNGRGAVVFPLAGPEGVWLGLDLAWMDAHRLVGAIRDATADHQREAALEAARADAEALNVGKSRFLANMSHELRTPLNAIMGFSDMMRQRIFGPLPGKYIEYADLIHDAGAHLLDLINDVLDMSKIEASKYELALEDFDAREPVAAALRLLRVQADDAGVQLRGVLPAEALEVRADRRALKQIVLNLVSNALKFTPRGGLVTVALAKVGGGALELSVADTGIGIAEPDLARLGRPYEQAGDVSQQAQGTGLGLSLVRAFAELHGGDMGIESRLGEGTAVTVRLPVAAAGEGPGHKAPPEPPGGEVIAFPQR
ncbi:MAG TPA: HAMP domain-containing sensor histidine kinase [Caulobacteraceae bacterium]|nr:HAMP domain-containing sensor histidine kinase [Caulobacteraceae bacterium]